MTTETEKPWFYSKTIWANLLVFIALILQSMFGFLLGASEQIAILTVVNIILRAVTKDAINWFN